MKSWSAAIQSALNALGQPQFAILLAFTTLALKYTNAPKAIVYSGATYSPATFILEGVAENFLAETPAASLRLTSLDAAQQARFFADSFRGETVTIRILYWDGSAWVDTTWTTTWTCDADQATGDEVTLRLSSSDAAQGTEVPRRTTQEAGCQHDYKRGGCPYRGSLATCDKGYATPNGCKVHFTDVTDPDTNVVIVQPKPYGGFLGGVPHRLVSGS